MSEVLDRAISELDGVASAHIETDGSSVVGVKVTLLEGADERAIGLAISRILEAHGYRSRVAPERVKVEPDAPPMPPVEVTAQPKREHAVNLESVTVEESWVGATVTVVDSAGGSVTLRAGSTGKGRKKAIVDAVASLLAENAASPPRLVEVIQREDNVLLVVLEDIDGARLAGASVIRSGLDFALATAVWAALTR
ncbi:MAG: hypothetical protein GWP04_12505 [Gammaproteobacteria bacterium]|nr:hypothetical protein [Gammaproteobacteria bacterium]